MAYVLNFFLNQESLNMLQIFFRKLLPGQNSSSLQVQLSSAENWPDLMIYATDKALLERLAENLSRHLGKKPRVWSEGEFSATSSKNESTGRYHLYLTSNMVDNVCNGLKLPYGYKEIEQELREKRAVLSDKGHTNDKTDKLVIDFTQPIPKVTMESFKEAYNKHYSSSFFRNIATTFSNYFKTGMRKQLDSGAANNIEKIEQYAKDNPESRTAEVYNSLKFGK